MFNIGGGELIVILLIALIVLGPQRLPDAAKQVGRVMGDLRRLSTGFQEEVRSALEAPEPAPRSTPREARPARTRPLVADPEPSGDVPKAGQPRTEG